MKEVKHYICEICGTEYADSCKAAVCEENHNKIVRIVGARYVSKKQNQAGSPITIDVLMENGNVLTYKR